MPMKNTTTLPSFYDNILTEEMGGICFVPTTPTTAPARLHFHTQFELGLCLEGRGIFYIHGNVYPYEAGDISVIYPGENHIAQSAQNAMSHWIFITVDIERIFAARQECGQLCSLACRRPGDGCILSAAESKQILPYLQRLISLHGEQDRTPAEKMGHYAALLSCILYESARWDRGGVHKPPQMGELHAPGHVESIYPAIQYIFAHYAEQIQIEQLCRVCSISQVHLRRLFSTHIGMSPLMFLQRIRISYACSELRSTAYAVLTIAERCGYGSLSSFNRQFRQLMHQSPTEYRAAHRKA